jgi:hypothetical protein
MSKGCIHLVSRKQVGEHPPIPDHARIDAVLQESLELPRIREIETAVEPLTWLESRCASAESRTLAHRSQAGGKGLDRPTAKT